jgi:hypothetical protein
MKQFRALLRLSPVLLFALACLAAGPARAGTCSNPTGNESDMTYNKDYHTMQFCDGTTWYSMKGSGGGSSGGLTLISTQTASASASLQFTSLPTTYNTLFLNCSGLITSANTVIPKFYIGEGAGPTWETTSNYLGLVTYTYGGGNNTCNNNTVTYPFYCNGDLPAAPTAPYSLKGYIDNVGSSSVYKKIDMTEDFYWTSQTISTFRAIGYWNTDTNPVTGIELVASGGTWVSGQCSLYGLN